MDAAEAAASGEVDGTAEGQLTFADTATVTYDLSTDFTKSPGKYVATVTYRVVPTY